MIEVTTAHTSELTATTLAAARAVLDEAFEGDFGDEDWEHTIGGIHALAWDGDELVGHASVVQRRLIYGGRALRAGYVEGVGVAAGRRRAGIGDRLMATIEQVIRGAYDLGALAATDDAIPFYRARGWRLWEGAAYALTPGGVVRTEDVDGGLFVLPVTEDLDVALDLTCDWRDGDVW